MTQAAPKKPLTLGPKRILIMAAGTGGHVFPALAVARQLQSMGHEIVWLATQHGMENRLLEGEGIEVCQINIKGIRGNGIKRLLAAPFTILKAVLASCRIIREKNIDAVAGFGGYVAGPGGVAAKLCGKPLIIHEQNAVAGLTNQWLSRISTQVLEAFPNSFKGAAQDQVLCIGNPVRASILELFGQVRTFDLSLRKPRLLVVGGSLGAQILNQQVPKALEKLNFEVQITHQCGRGHLDVTQAAYAALSARHEIAVTEFISDMAQAFAAHDLVICRAGASTVSELAAVGLPSILVPLPSAVDDHQTANARYLSEAGAAVLILQSELGAEFLASQIAQTLNTEQLLVMSAQAKSKALLEADRLAANHILAALKLQTHSTGTAV